MTTNASPAPGSLQTKLTTALSGSQTALAKNSAIQISGKSTTPTQIITALQGYIQPFTDVAAAKAAYAKALQARKAEQAEAHEYLLTLKAGLVALFGRYNPVLAQFGMAAKTRAVATTQTTMLAVAKRALTRQLRGTLSKKQKAATKTGGTPDVNLGRTGKSFAPGAAAAAQSAALAAAASGGASAPTVAAPATPAAGTIVTPSPVAPAPATNTTASPALTAAAVKQS